LWNRFRITRPVVMQLVVEMSSRVPPCNAGGAICGFTRTCGRSSRRRNPVWSDESKWKTAIQLPKMACHGSLSIFQEARPSTVSGFDRFRGRNGKWRSFCELPRDLVVWQILYFRFKSFTKCFIAKELKSTLDLI
jgi:hypothetical protein